MVTEQFNWTFKGYTDHRGNHIQIWYENQLADVRAEFRMTLQDIRRKPQWEWADMGRSKDLKGRNKRGLIELRFKVNKVPYRPIGIFAGGRQTFVILAVAQKADFEDQCGAAMARKRLVETNPGVHSHESQCLSDIAPRT